jgi:hypothetical protein
MHQDQADPGRAEKEFAFLLERGFRVEERYVSGGTSFKDGWQLVYIGAHVTVTVRYVDMEFDVRFSRGGFEVDYRFVDREFRGHQSRLQGNMFPPQRVGAVIDRVAADIRDNFQAILDGDPTEWARIKRRFEAPKVKARLP